LSSSNIVKSHLPCPSCPSSDAYSEYDDGHGYCYSCQTYFPANKSSKIQTEYKAIPSRKLTAKTCEFYKYGVGTYKGKPCQVANYGKAQKLRFPDKTFAVIGDGKNLPLFGQNLFTEGGLKVIITEGEIDCLSVAQATNLKWAVVSLPSGAGSAEKSIKDSLEWLESFQEVILMFDNDDPGREAVSKTVELFSPGKVKVFQYPEGYKDANELLQAGLGGAIIDGIFKAKAYRPDGIISGQDLLEDVLSEPLPGLTIPYPEMNRMFDGLRYGSLYLFTAGSGIGKTTIVHELAYHLMMVHKETIGVIALEENKRKTAKRYPGIYLNHPLTLNRFGLTDSQIKEAFEKTTGSGRFFLYDHWGSLNLDRLIGKIRYMIKGLGCKWIILDHISIVVSGLDEIGESERKLIDKLMTRLRALIEETQASILAVVHLSRATDNSTKGWNEGKQVSLRSLRGSGALEQLSDAVIALERDQQGDNKDESIIRVLKNRELGITGVADTLLYNHKTGRLLPVGEQQVKFEDF
jgi:twinkle protein